MQISQEHQERMGYRTVTMIVVDNVIHKNFDNARIPTVNVKQKRLHEES